MTTLESAGESDGRYRVIAAGVSVTWAASICCGVSPANGVRPVRSS